ncbi:MAG: STAS domain-containing protein [Planctomycetota bacterium]|jgi:anti-anti-sigma factor
MRSFFSRRPQPRKAKVARNDSPAWAQITANPIATIDRLGPTAVATLTVSALARSEGVAGLMGLFEAVSRSGAQGFVLDIQNLEYMDSACLGCLVKALNFASADGGRIALANADAAIQSLFRTTALDRRFPICHDVASALTNVERGASFR